MKPLDPSPLSNPLDRMEIRFDGLNPVGGLRRVDGARFGMTRTRLVNGVPEAKAHSGVDLFAEPGTPIRAIADGEVVLIRHETGNLGTDVTLRFRPQPEVVARLAAAGVVSPDGHFFALYAHLQTVIAPRGPVRRGAVLGLTGLTGNADQRYPHLHFELRTRLYPGLGLINRGDPELILTGIDFSKPYILGNMLSRMA